MHYNIHLIYSNTNSDQLWCVLHFLMGRGNFNRPRLIIYRMRAHKILAHIIVLFAMIFELYYTLANIQGRSAYRDRRSTYREGPHTGKVHIQGRSTYREGPHNGKVRIQGRSTYREGPHTGKVHIQRRSTYRVGPHTGKVHIQGGPHTG